MHLFEKHGFPDRRATPWLWLEFECSELSKMGLSINYNEFYLPFVNVSAVDVSIVQSFKSPIIRMLFFNLYIF